MSEERKKYKKLRQEINDALDEEGACLILYSSGLLEILNKENEVVIEHSNHIQSNDLYVYFNQREYHCVKKGFDTNIFPKLKR